jgi:hypothetical protein
MAAQSFPIARDPANRASVPFGCFLSIVYPFGSFPQLCVMDLFRHEFFMYFNSLSDELRHYPMLVTCRVIMES